MRALALLLALSCPLAAQVSVRSDVSAGTVVMADMCASGAFNGEPPAGLVSYYRADAGVTGASPVTAWASSGPAALSLTASATPALVTDGADQAIDFEVGDSDFFFRTITSEPTNEPFAAWIVFTLESGGTPRNMLGLSPDADVDDRFVLRTQFGATDAAAAQAVAAGTGATALHGTALSTATRYLIYGDWESNTDRTVNLDGGTAVDEATSTAVTTPNRLSVGSGRNVASAPHDGLIFEVVLMSAKPSTSEVARYQLYADLAYAIPGY